MARIRLILKLECKRFRENKGEAKNCQGSTPMSYGGGSFTLFILVAVKMQDVPMTNGCGFES